MRIAPRLLSKIVYFSFLIFPGVSFFRICNVAEKEPTRRYCTETLQGLNLTSNANKVNFILVLAFIGTHNVEADIA